MTAETPTRTRPDLFDPGSFEQKWRDRWEADELDIARDEDPRPKRYILTMYPYPSGDLHIGHWYAATGPDIVARMHRMVRWMISSGLVMIRSRRIRSRRRCWFMRGIWIR